MVLPQKKLLKNTPSIHLLYDYDREKHEYSVKGIVYPSVTQIIPKQNFYMPAEKLEKYAEEGTANHKAVEEMLDTGATTSSYAETVAIFMDKYKAQTGELIAYEIPLFSPAGFAGTPDLIFEYAIVDMKRSFGNPRIHALQLAGYNRLAVDNKLIKSTKMHWILVVDDAEQRKFSVHNVYNSDAAFTFESCLQLYIYSKRVEEWSDKRDKMQKAIDYYLKGV